jgi:hypothetical protein
MKHKKVYNVFEVDFIVFLVICIMLVPIFSIVSYIFDFHLHVDTSTILYTSLGITIAFFISGLIYLLIKRDELSRKLKPYYQREFSIVMTVSGLGVLGSGIIFLYLGGPSLYVPHVIIPLGIIVFSSLYLLGDQYFNVSLTKRTTRKK